MLRRVFLGRVVSRIVEVSSPQTPQGAQFYITAQYGFEAEYLASAQNLFEKAEAELPIRHAEECSLAATILRSLDGEKLAALASKRAL
jgi:hypothetical protein